MKWMFSGGFCVHGEGLLFAIKYHILGMKWGDFWGKGWGKVITQMACESLPRSFVKFACCFCLGFFVDFLQVMLEDCILL